MPYLAHRWLSPCVLDVVNLEGCRPTQIIQSRRYTQTKPALFRFQGMPDVAYHFFQEMGDHRNGIHALCSQPLHRRGEPSHFGCRDKCFIH